ncbi:MAG: DUF1214 domain-containing protein [Gammaproteobacteria bacterium]|nr:DUF1214 domain-containing protein [Gammaproteobacteria bacterium]
MPLLNFKGFRDGHAAVGVGYNDVGYHSKVQNWKYQTATPNDTTPYISFYWTIKDGPIVIEIPPSADGIGVFGTLLDAWQRPIDDVGAVGRDKGLGGTYVLLPAGYEGPILPNAFTYQQRTDHGFAVLRPILPDRSNETLAKAAKFAQSIRIYPLAQADDPPEMNYVDTYDVLIEMTPVLNGDIYAQLHEILQEEPIETQNLSMMGLLAKIGIRKNEPYTPDAAAQAVFDQAGPEALEFMIEQYHRTINPWMYEGRKWSVLIPPGAIGTDFSYEYPNYFDYSSRGAIFYAIITSVKNYGSATFYLDLAETADGEWLDGGANHKLHVPPNVPAGDFWSVVAYDLETAAWIRDVPKVGLDSTRPDLQANEDGSVDIYFGPEAPDGLESNWIPTVAGRRFILLFRFYGPQAGVFDGSFELNDIERIN